MLVALLAALPGLAVAGDLGQKDAGEAWHQTSDCARDAFKQFPDYTPESNAKREAARRTCLRKHKLPAPEGAVLMPSPTGARQ